MTISDFYLKDIWLKVLNKLQESGQVSDDQMPYFNADLIELTEDHATISCDLFINFIILNQYVNTIEICFEEVLDKRIKVYFVDNSQEGNNNLNKNSSFTNSFISLRIEPSQTFANFVVGRSNAQAQIAALTVATNLGFVYNPLFIYGNSGLGKTHLLNAIGNHVSKNFRDKKIGYITGLQFVEGVHKAEVEKKYDEFKNSFNNLDVLLVDDIQFIAGKPKTHEIFFTVFNYLINNRKQICITSDKTPSEIKGLEERVISRFNQGLTVNIEAPEYETSLNILKMKISNNSTITQIIDDEVLSYIATNFSYDVRSLEGAINRLLFYSINFSSEDHITLKLANEAFKDLIKENKHELSITNVRKVVCDYYNLTKQQIISANRTKNIANARHIAMFLCRKLIDAPYKEIGNEFGGRDHSTVMSACMRVEKLVKTDPLYLKAINEIESRIK